MDRDYNKYIVLKNEDTESLSVREKRVLAKLLNKVERGRKARGKPQRRFVVIQDNWPMFDTVWRMIEGWVDGMTHGYIGNKE